MTRTVSGGVPCVSKNDVSLSSHVSNESNLKSSTNLVLFCVIAVVRLFISGQTALTNTSRGLFEVPKGNFVTPLAKVHLKIDTFDNVVEVAVCTDMSDEALLGSDLGLSG